MMEKKSIPTECGYIKRQIKAAKSFIFKRILGTYSQWKVDLEAHDKIDVRTASEVTGRSRATASRYLQQLVKLNVLGKRGDSVITTFQRK